MADPQDRPDSESEGESTPPAKKASQSPPAKKAAKAPAKKAPAKKAPAKKAAAKKAPAKKAPPKSPEPTPPTAADEALGVQHRAQTNGELAAAAKDAAAQAKSTVDRANDPLPRDASEPASSSSAVPLAIAVVLSLLALLLVRQLRRH